MGRLTSKTTHCVTQCRQTWKVLHDVIELKILVPYFTNFTQISIQNNTCCFCALLISAELLSSYSVSFRCYVSYKPLPEKKNLTRNSKLNVNFQSLRFFTEIYPSPKSIVTFRNKINSKHYRFLTPTPKPELKTPAIVMICTWLFNKFSLLLIFRCFFSVCKPQVRPDIFTRTHLDVKIFS